MKRERKPADFKLGTITVSYIEMFDEAIAITKKGTQLIIDTYFSDLSDMEIPQKYVFDWGMGKQGYLFTVINHLYKSSKAKNKRRFKKLLAEALPFLVDPKNGLIQKEPELCPAKLEEFNKVLCNIKIEKIRV